MKSPLLPGRKLSAQAALCASLVMLTIQLPGWTQPTKQTAWGTAKQFYLWNLRHPTSGLPSAQEQAQLKPWLSPELSQLLQQALNAEIRCSEATPPDIKPPLAEGNFFMNNNEGATVLHQLKVVSQSSQTHLQADLGYVDQRFPPGHRYHAYRWSDRLILTPVSGQWRIQDIRFTDRPSLVTMLKDYQSELNKCAVLKKGNN